MSVFKITPCIQCSRLGTVADGDRQLVFTASILSGFLQSSVGFEPVVHFNRSIAQQRLYLPMDKKSYTSISLYWVITLNQGGRVPVNITLIRPSIPPQNRSVFGHCSASELYIKGTHLIDWGTKERQTPYRGSLTPLHDRNWMLCFLWKDRMFDFRHQGFQNSCSHARKSEPFYRKYNCVKEISSWI